MMAGEVITMVSSNSVAILLSFRSNDLDRAVARKVLYVHAGLQTVPVLSYPAISINLEMSDLSETYL